MDKVQMKEINVHIACVEWVSYHVKHCRAKIPYRASNPSPEQ
jgi:hypothetical protein